MVNIVVELNLKYMISFNLGDIGYEVVLEVGYNR